VIPFPAQRPIRAYSPPVGRPTPASDSVRRVPPPPSSIERGGQDLSDMEIPTFIRRQMD
jgi:hypothetical protein